MINNKQKKVKSAFYCSSCQAESSRWQGQCGTCKSWNTISEVEQIKSFSRSVSGYSGMLETSICKLEDIDVTEEDRIDSGFIEFNRVLGGGVVKGSAVLIGGHPGAGKSTLLLQIACELSKKLNILYITGEESLRQVALRAKRLKLPTDKLQVLTETCLDRIASLALQVKPDIIIIDSIQVMYLSDISSSPGSVTQVRESAAFLTRFAKVNSIAVMMVGHVTKDGSLAGPKVLEHCVDCSLLLEGDSDNRFRTLRCYKNRLGAVNEIGVFSMTDSGLREVINPSAMFLSGSVDNIPGSVVMPIWEGSRSLLVEIQALVDSASSSNSRRVLVGLDSNRLGLLLAVLHKHCNLFIADCDIFVNVVGGVKVFESGSDLTLLAAIVSSFNNFVISKDTIIFGEVGLSGEIRPVSHAKDRISDARKHGFKKAIVPHKNASNVNLNVSGIEVIPVVHVNDFLDYLNN